MLKTDSLDIEKLRRDFPILSRKFNDRKLVYLDSAATSQRPQAVIDATVSYYRDHNANVHRGIYALSEEASELYEGARERIARFVNVPEGYSTIYTRGTTESINLIAYSWALQNIKKGDEIITTIMEHHSNMVPWLSFREAGVKVNFVDIKDDYTLDMGGLEKAITRKTKLLAIGHVSNALGTINDVAEAFRIAHDHGALVVVDGAQSVPHIKTDLKRIGADFFAFSGHKMLGPTGIGILCARSSIMEETKPFLYGGDMIKEVHTTGAKWNDLPWKFEAGTTNIAGAIGLGAAVDYLSKIGMENVREHEKSLLTYALGKLSSIEGLKVYGPEDPELRSGVISFNLADIHPHDMATIADNHGIAIRSGHHCAQPLMERLGVPATSRASFYIYNTKEEVDVLIEMLEDARKVFRV